mmetsp:Transcript_121388/g.234177  ORF Transcript_121388/g.234177 Transcript_121388/m.234177 type:complete len:233 (-) Transcript_121388:134-832(-)
MLKRPGSGSQVEEHHAIAYRQPSLSVLRSTMSNFQLEVPWKRCSNSTGGSGLLAISSLVKSRPSASCLRCGCRQPKASTHRYENSRSLGNHGVTHLPVGALLSTSKTSSILWPTSDSKSPSERPVSSSASKCLSESIRRSCLSTSCSSSQLAMRLWLSNAEVTPRRKACLSCLACAERSPLRRCSLWVAAECPPCPVRSKKSCGPSFGISAFAIFANFKTRMPRITLGSPEV